MVQQAQAPGSQALAQSYADTHTLAAITRRRSLQKMSQRHRSAHVQRLGLGLSCTNGTVRVLLSEGIGGGKQRHNTGRLRARAAPAPRPPRAEETAATHAIFNPPPPPPTGESSAVCSRARTPPRSAPRGLTTTWGCSWRGEPDSTPLGGAGPRAAGSAGGAPSNA